jgi:hypothetical protein
MATYQGDCSMGAALESTFGTIVTPTKFPEFTDASFDWNPTFVQGQGLRVGSRGPRSARRVKGKEQAGGDLTVECASKGQGFLWKSALGTVTTTQRATTGVYQQNHTAIAGDFLDSYTWQKGVPAIGGGAANAETYAGSVCSGFEFTAANADIAKLKTTWLSKSVGTATAYAAPSYPTPVELFSFVQASLVIGGSITPATTTALATGGTSVANIRDFAMTFDNGLDDGGFNFNGAGQRNRKPALGMWSLTGTMTAEYVDNTLRDAFLNQTDLALVLTFLGASTIGTGSDNPAMQIYITDFRLEGELPKPNSGQVITQSLGFTAFDNLSTAPLTVSYVSTDTAP